MNDQQVLQNKATKITLNRPLYSSATDAIITLKWLNLEQHIFYHRCIYVYKCINGLMDHSMELLANRDIPNYNTRNRDMLRLALATKNLGKQRVCYHPLKDWNNLDKATTNAPDIVNFKHSIFGSFSTYCYSSCVSIAAFCQFLIYFLYVFLFLGIFHFTVYGLIYYL